MSIGNVSVDQSGRGMVPQFAIQKKAKVKSVPEGYKLLEKEGWSSEIVMGIIILKVFSCPGLKAGEIAEAVADSVGLSPEARKVMVVSRKTGEVDPKNEREKYKADVYHALEVMKRSGLMKQDGSGGYIFTDNGCTIFQGLMRGISVATSVVPSVVDSGPIQVNQEVCLDAPVLIVHQVQGIITEH